MEIVIVKLKHKNDENFHISRWLTHSLSVLQPGTDSEICLSLPMLFRRKLTMACPQAKHCGMKQ
jgi:hypothetical protein